MRLAHLIALACTLLVLSACIVDPYGGGGRGYYYGGDYGHHDYGRRVWRE